jgi:hypothetical protein
MEGGHMRRNLGWLWIVGFFGLLASANAQTASPPTTTTQFDGTYAFVSATKSDRNVLGLLGADETMFGHPDRGTAYNRERSGAVFDEQPVSAAKRRKSRIAGRAIDANNRVLG